MSKTNDITIISFISFQSKYKEFVSSLIFSMPPTSSQFSTVLDLSNLSSVVGKNDQVMVTDIFFVSNIYQLGYVVTIYIEYIDNVCYKLGIIVL